MEAERLLYLFREFLWIEEESAVEGYIDDVLLQAGATEDEIKFIKGEM